MSRIGSTGTLSVAAVMLIVHCSAGLSQVPLSDDIELQTVNVGEHSQPAIATARDGFSMAVWARYIGHPPGGGIQDWEVVARAIDAAGTPLGTQTLISVANPSTQYNPRVAPSGNRFVAVWDSYQEPSGDQSLESVRARFIDRAGQPVDQQFQVNTYAAGSQRAPDVAAFDGGDFIVVWQSDGSSGSDDDQSSIQGQRFSSTGTPIGVEFQVNTSIAGRQQDPKVATLPDGSFAVAWHDQEPATRVRGRLFDPAGVPRGDDFILQDAEIGGRWTGIGADARPPADGGIARYLAAWTSWGAPGSDPNGDFFGTGVRARSVLSSGEGAGSEVQVNTMTELEQSIPEVCIDGNGVALVVWITNNGNDVKGRLLWSDGTPLGEELRVNSESDNSQGLPALACTPGGVFTAIWRDENFMPRIAMRRFAGPILFFDGFETGAVNRWDAAEVASRALDEYVKAP